MTAKVFALTNHKGGVCKTTLTVTLADAFQREGLEVLVVDLDPQANATKHMYGYDVEPSVTLADLFRGRGTLAEAIIQETKIKSVHLIGGHLNLAAMEWDLLRDAYTSATLLRDTLAPVLEFYDVIILDCPPSLGFYMTTALVAADAIFVPVESGSKFALTGTDDVKHSIERARRINPNLKTVAAILTKHDARKKVCKLTANELPNRFPNVLASYWPDTTNVEQALVLGQTILQFKNDDIASKQARAMAREIMDLTGLKAKEVADGVDE